MLIFATRRMLPSLALLVLCCLPASARQARPAGPSRAAAPRTLARGYGRTPLHFVANQGQFAPEVRFQARGQGYTLFLTNTEAVLVLGGSAKGEVGSAKCPDAGGPGRRRSPEHSALRTPHFALRMRLAGANAHPAVAPEGRLPGVVNVIRGKDRSQWRTGIPTYARARFRGVYPGIDLVYYGNQGQLEYDFVVAPGADPRRIRLAFDGAEKTSVDRAGDLVVTSSGRGVGRPVQEVRFRKPHVYQEVAGRKVAVAAGWSLDEGFRLQGAGLRQTGRAGVDRKSKTENRKSATFRLARYDRSRPLVIDPVLLYSTLLGGLDNDHGIGIAVDASGCAYLTGETYSDDFPKTTGPAELGSWVDAFVAKLGAGGEILYATYFGGTSDDYGYGIAVDASGCAYVTGETMSDDFPATLGVLPIGEDTQAFAAKLNAAGLPIYANCFGGDGYDSGWGIAVDGSGCAYVTGGTESSDFPITPGGQPYTNYADVFVAKFSSAGAVLYRTCLGGAAGSECGRGIVVDGDGNAYVVGETSSSDFPTTPGLTAYAGGEDAFVAGFSPTGAVVYCSCLGDGGDDYGTGISLLGIDGIVFISGAAAISLGGTPPVYDIDGFIAAFSQSGELLVALPLHGSDQDVATGVAVDGTGLVHIAGATWSADFLDSGGGPAPPGLVPLGVSTPSGGCDAFVVTLDTVADTEWHTLLGGTGDDRANGLAVDPSGSIYVVGTTSSSGFPNSGNLPFAGGSDAFVAKFGELGTPNRLRFLTQPTNVLRLLPFAPAVQVEVLDAVGQRVTTAGNTITLALTTTPSTGLYGTRTVAAVNGVATFPDLRVSRLGKGQTLTASAAGLIGATSDPFDVVTAVPVRLRMLQEPSSAAAGQAITPAVQVEVVDALGRRVTNGTHAVRMGLYINRTRAPFTNFTTVNTVEGVATYPNVRISRPGSGYVLEFLANRLSGVRSVAFPVTP